MQRFQLLTLTALALALAAIIGACDDRPTTPTPTPSTTPGTRVTITDLTISGPTTIAPGETTQFTATARQSDGSTHNVTNEATWATGSQSVLVVSATGAATGRERGESWIQASLGGRHAVINEVIVVPAGTYRLTGRLTDRDPV